MFGLAGHACLARHSQPSLPGPTTPCLPSRTGSGHPNLDAPALPARTNHALPRPTQPSGPNCAAPALPSPPCLARSRLPSRTSPALPDLSQPILPGPTRSRRASRCLTIHACPALPHPAAPHAPCSAIPFRPHQACHARSDRDAPQPLCHPDHSAASSFVAFSYSLSAPRICATSFRISRGDGRESTSRSSDTN